MRISLAQLAVALLTVACAGVATIPARPADVGTLDGLMRAFYETINVAADAPRQWDRDRTLYAPWIRFVAIASPTSGDDKVAVYDHEAFVAFAEPLVRAGIVERELGRIVRRYGNIASVESSYELTVGREVGRGVNYIQAYFDGRRWWITSVAWQTEDAAHPIPPELLPAARTD